MLNATDDLKVSEIMSPVDRTIDCDVLLSDFIKNRPLNDVTQELFSDSAVLFVVNKLGRLLGVLREKDLLKAAARLQIKALSVQDIMLPITESVASQSSHHEASQILIRTKLRFVPVVEQNKPIGVVWTDSILAAHASAYKAKLNQLNDALARIAYRDEFLGILVHDLRSPLGAISACCDLIKMSPTELPKSHVDLLETIKKNASRCINLAQDLLEFGKLNSGLNVDLEIVEIHSCLDEFVHNLKIIGSQMHGVELVTDWCGSIGVQVDRNRFAQIIDNLVINAFKSTPRGKKVTIKTDLVDDFKRENKALRIQVIDEGPGIPRQKINSIFDRYTQIHEIPENETGVGLGLSITAQFVRLHNGEIHVDGGGEDSGHGAIFSVLLPNASILRTESMRATAKGLSKILVIDDDDDILETVVDALRGNTYDIRTAHDGAEGLEIFTTWDPDIVLSDVKMPRKNGIELLNDIKSQSPGTPVILLSGALEEFGENDVKFSLKPEAYLAKPFKTSDLTSMVQKFLKEQMTK